jgi:hypothetical protein
VGLFAIVTEDLLKLSGACLCNQLSCRLTSSCVKAEVKEAARANAESALAINELIRREPKIEIDTIDLAESCIGNGARKVCTAPVECGEAVAESSESRAAHCDRATIRINAEKESARSGAFEYRLSVPPTAEIGVNVGAVMTHR